MGNPKILYYSKEKKKDLSLFFGSFLLQLSSLIEFKFQEEVFQNDFVNSSSCHKTNSYIRPFGLKHRLRIETVTNCVT